MLSRLSGRGRQQLLQLDEATLQQPPQSEVYLTSTLGGGGLQSPAEVAAASRKFDTQGQSVATAESGLGFGSAPPTPSRLSMPSTPSRLSPGAAVVGKMSRAYDRVRGRGHARLSEDQDEEPPHGQHRDTEKVGAPMTQTAPQITDPALPQPRLLGAPLRSPTTSRLVNAFKRSEERKTML